MNLSNFFKQNTDAFGFDISDVSIKIVQFAKKGEKFKIVAFGDYDLPKGIMVNDTIMDEKLIIDHIHNALNKMDFGQVNTNQIVASVPESKAFVRVIQIPKMTLEQAKSAVPFESEQYIPIPIEQTYLDWQIIAERDDKMDVLVTACPRDFIDTYLRVLKQAGLHPVAMEVESVACARALISAERKDKDTLILDMDTYRSSLIVVEDGNLQFTSSVPIAGDVLTQSIANYLGIPGVQAEKVKRQFGLLQGQELLAAMESGAVDSTALNASDADVVKKAQGPAKTVVPAHPKPEHLRVSATPTIKEEGIPDIPVKAAPVMPKDILPAITPAVDNLIAEIRNIIKFHDEHAKGKIDEIILCGGTAKLKGLTGYIANKFSEPEPMHVIQGNPWVNITIEGKTAGLNTDDSLSYTTAIGLAMLGAQLPKH